MYVLVLVTLILVSAFFSAAEIALTASRRTRLQTLADDGDSRAPRILQLKDTPGNFFTVVQIGVNAVAILAGIIGERQISDTLAGWLAGWLADWLPQARADRVANLAGFVIVTGLFILFADLLPKRLAVLYPERFALAIIGPMQGCLRVLRPVVWVFNGAADLILKLLGVPTQRVEQITTEDIAAMVGAGAEAGVLRKYELAVIENVFELESRTVTSVMTVRDDIVYFTLDEPLESIKRKIVGQPHAEYLVCRDDIDSVLGFIASKDILQQILSEESSAVIRNVGKHYNKNLLVLPDTLNLSQALARFREMHERFGAVVNEYGLVVGVATLDDIVGAVMGDILYLGEDEQIVRRDDGSCLVDGITPIADVKRAFDLDDLPGEHYVETIAGLVIYALKRIPKKSESVDIGPLHIEVLDIDSHRIDQLLVSRRTDGPAASTPATPAAS
ncbi:hemolysin family protein [Ralstonia nicotianae]|uniref:Polyamine export protein n=1 Tax=Ralstonia pseudosolanacearum TaxID=1310165 RepID=A0A454TP57_9RALS|nr:hemolysin family protein [Ralstonia pseudosolanacearum]OIT16306.1 magnesium transporter [Ralstonia solanacearum]MCK4133859.1 HlyC/CorC family transporter [Ralstonia pseudosolanacearum]MCK4144443.1 HlyC/CorC family transporter [Ralstonia pseudosolanacearum]MDK1381629.1 hemolysin family protein [Ralstonia pseudosolanacearum]RAA06782.1 HlyC/CorC family transporter [Ralstonia pseudosolanacearum]